MPMSRGVLYIVWGEKCEALLERSIESLRRFHPELAVHVERVDASAGLRNKAAMSAISPFDSTLYLDADTVVLGDLSHGFAVAEKFGLAVTICECPWLRRYGEQNADETEYNTGVIFFTRLADTVMKTWDRLADTTPARSRWLTAMGQERGLAFDDQASFSRAVIESGFNPAVLPLNWNFRPEFFVRAFAPIKIWHDYRDVPEKLAALSRDCQSGAEPVTMIQMT